MIELYAMASPNVQKIYLLLEELGLPYRTHFIDVWKGEQFSERFVALNPNSKVPVIVDHDGPNGRYVVFESGAIMLYLSEKADDTFMPRETAAKYDALQWFMIQMTTVGPMLGQFNHFQRFAPKDNDYARARYRSEVRRIYDMLDGRLAKTPFLGGETYTLADIATFPWIRTFSKFYGGDVPFVSEGNAEYPALWRWFRAITSRAAVVKALALIDAIPSTVAAASSDDLDRTFGRGRYARS